MGSVPCPCTSSSWEKEDGVIESTTVVTYLKWRSGIYRFSTTLTVGLWESNSPLSSIVKVSLEPNWNLVCQYVLPIGIPYSDSPQHFGPPQTVYQHGPSHG